MTPDTPKRTRLIVTVIVVIAAFLMIAVVPRITGSIINPIVKGQLGRAQKFVKMEKMIPAPYGKIPAAPTIKPMAWVISTTYPFWTVLTFIGGFALLAFALPLYRGAQWVRGPALVALAMPAIAGGYMMVPWINFVFKKTGGMPPTLWIMAIGLIPYFAILLAEKSDIKQKAVNFGVFLMLGVTAAENFPNGQACARMLFFHPTRPVLAPGDTVLWLFFMTAWISLIFLIISIWKLGNREWAGWYFGVIGASSVMVAAFSAHYVRHTFSTDDYLYNSLMGLTLLILLLIPGIKKRLFDEPEPQAPAAA